MQKEIIKYPNPSIRLIGANVRFFDDELKSQIEDMIDTMKANNLNALSAILINIQYNIVVIKSGDDYIPYINGRIIRHSGMATATERSIYYDGISVDVDRYERITVAYEDENGVAKYVDFEGDEARTFQHYLDYSFGSTFVDRVDKDVKQRIDGHLEFGLVKDSRGNEQCPIVLYREYFKKAARYVMMFLVATFITPLFFDHDVVVKIYEFDKKISLLVPILVVAYFFYARYEAEKFKQCTSCQIGNIIGSIFILLVQFIIVLTIVFLWMGH